MNLQRMTALSIAGGILLFSSQCSFAQQKAIELKNVENFSKGHKMVYLELKDSVVMTKVTPSPITWDFSSLKIAGDTIYQELIDVPEAYKKTFPKANLVEKRSDGSMVFTEKTATESKVWGIDRQGMLMPYTVPYPFIKRPFRINDSITGHPERAYTAYGNSAKGSGNTKTSAESWGTLLLPDGKHEVLKVVFEQHYVDVAVGSDDKTYADIVTHAWFDAQHKGALLKVTEVKIAGKYYNNTLRTTELLLSETK